MLYQCCAVVLVATVDDDDRLFITMPVEVAVPERDGISSLGLISYREKVDFESHASVLA